MILGNIFLKQAVTKKFLKNASYFSCIRATRLKNISDRLILDYNVLLPNL